MSNELTQKQKAVLEFLQGYDQAGGCPTYREIAEHFGFNSPKAATDFVSALERKGKVRRRRGRSRGIEIISAEKAADRATIEIPILGQIGAGIPAEGIQMNAGGLLVDERLLGAVAGNRLFFLKVYGDSMTGRGVYDGDLVVADRDCAPSADDMVIALIDGQSTLKTLAFEKGAFFLRAENPRFRDIVPVVEMTIQGVVKLILRQVK
ncbi:MAG: transcriptional repressor LexA [Syntrophobacteraceae bacterium]